MNTNVCKKNEKGMVSQLKEFCQRVLLRLRNSIRRADNSTKTLQKKPDRRKAGKALGGKRYLIVYNEIVGVITATNIIPDDLVTNWPRHALYIVDLEMGLHISVYDRKWRAKQGWATIIHSVKDIINE